MNKASSFIVIGVGLAAAVLAPVLQLTLDPVSYIAGASAYLLTLTVLGIALWIGFRLTNAEFGWRWGRLGDHLLAFAYPVLVMAALTGYASATGALDLSGPIDWQHAARNVGLMALSTLVAALLTEEGFFRGALWGASVRVRWSGAATLLVTSILFVAWHVAVPFVDREYHVPTDLLPYYFANATLLALSWGLLRWASGSVLVPCVAHATWNGLAYALFGDGDKAGALHITNFAAYDPERGAAGIAANAIMLLMLALWARGRGRSGAV